MNVVIIVCIDYVKTEYRHKNTGVSWSCYHLVFCPLYRRKIFLVPGVEDRFKELVREISCRSDFELLALECDTDHCHIFVNVPPDIRAADAVRVIKTNTARPLLAEFEAFRHMRHLWTRSYFASTAGKVSQEAIERYSADQKKRG